MIQIYADDARVWDAGLGRYVYQNNVLVYDSRLEDFDLVGLTVTTGLNVGGTADIVMPSDHPAYETFQPYKTLVRVYREGADGNMELRFRGRVLYTTDDFLRQRTVTCEGELCLLRDSISRPYAKVGASPRSFFVTLLNAHNTQMEVAKRFTIGSVTVPSTTIELENENAETVLDALNNLVELVGGYITFNDAEDGSRVINWLAELTNTSGQRIEFGENLLDFNQTGANSVELVTGLIPYGAQLEVTDPKTGKKVKSKERLTIKAANEQFPNQDYILAQDAVYERSTIMGTVVWDEVTTASELYDRAVAYLAGAKLFVTSLELTALDLSYMDKSIDSFSVGDMIHVVSEPHGINALFQLTQMTEDLLDPSQGKITLGKDIQSLTSAGVAADKRAQAGVSSVRTEVHSVDLSGYATVDQLGGYVVKEELGGYATTEQLGSYATTGDLSATQSNLAQRIAAEETARKALVEGADGVTHIYADDQVKIHKRVRMIGSMLDFDNAQGVRIYNNDGTVYYQLRVDENNNTFVGTDTNKLYLRGPTVYLKQSNAVVTSDRRAKHSIEELPDAYVEALDKMVPVRFKYNDGQSDRYHVGFIAQDVEGALTDAGLCGKDFGGFVDVNGDGSELGLAYDEFIGLLFAKIRKLEERIKVLEDDTR